ncbi:NAD-dependent epimerase/dehydratase family protein [Aquipuribacter hungaricus]|uniref:NAD-dependent epimerase/dehydratase family protein n=1 Tax=Aquipuribacter hungaricus TaxID=545624 RepID=A0ABV7WH04_9MICO
MATVLVTGATGTLGRDVVPALRARGVDPLLLSRSPARGSRYHQADLVTGRGVADALAGVGTVVHLAAGKDQVAAARDLLDAASA